MIKFIKKLFKKKNLSSDDIIVCPDPEVSIFVGNYEYILMFDKKGYVRYKIKMTDTLHTTAEGVN